MQNSQGVSDAPIGVPQAGEHFLGKGDVVCVIDAARPQAHQICTVFADEMASFYWLIVGARF